MGVMRVLICVALAGVQFVYGLPLGTPHTYPQDKGGVGNTVYDGWNADSMLYAGVPALALVLAAVGLIFGCTWCYRHKGSKLFSASVSQLSEASRRAQPDSGFSEPANNNISEDNNNGPISLREMQNIANNNAAAYIVSENEDREARNRSRESVVEFEPLPAIAAPDPLDAFADWFVEEDFPRDQLQYLREIGRGWFGRTVEGELDGQQSTVAVKILSHDATAEQRARFLRDARVHLELHHENILPLLAKGLRLEPWILVFEMCPTDLQQYLLANRSNAEALIESGTPLRLANDVTAALAHMHSRGFLYGNLRAETVLIRGAGEAARCVLGRYADAGAADDALTAADDVSSLGVVLWQTWAWGEPAAAPPLPRPHATPLFADHMYQVMQMCWQPHSSLRPSAAQVQLLLQHLLAARLSSGGGGDFEERWQRLKPNTIPVVDEHVALIHAPSASTHFEHLKVDPVSRSSSVVSDKDLEEQIKSESMTNLHGSLEDIRNIYLTHNEAPAQECNHANDLDSTVDPWLKDIIAGSQDDVSYYKDVSDVIKNLDNMLNSEKTSSSESSHQASPSRDNLSLDCKREAPAQSGLVKSPGIRDFQNLEADFEDPSVDEELDAVGTLSHSYERRSDTASQHTLANLTPDTPCKDMDFVTEETPVVSAPELDVSEEKSEVTEDCDIVEARTYHPSLEPLMTRLTDEVTSEKETDRSSAGVTEIPLEETKTDSQGNVVIDEYLDETVSSDLPIVTRSEEGDIRVQIESQDKVQSDDRVKDNVETCVAETVPEKPLIDDVIRESELIVDSVITAATEALSPNKMGDVCDLDAPVSLIIDTVQSDQQNDNNSPNREEESTLVETINEVTDLKESNDSHSPLVQPNLQRPKDDDVTDVSESIEDRSLDTASTLPIGNHPDVQTNVNESTVYMDLQNETMQINKQDTMSDTLKQVINTCVENAPLVEDQCTLVRDNSTMYMELPSAINETKCFLTNEREVYGRASDVTASTPKGDAEKVEDPVQKSERDNISPFDSPTRSHPTDTYDENSSVMLGPFENCSEYFKNKPSDIEIPKEELLAFSSNFSELNLATPSPLRDVNFLNEVPDIEVSETDTEQKRQLNIDQSEGVKAGPSTPPNSPGNFLATSNYAEPLANPSGINSSREEIDINQIELQITSKLAMAENENNMNIEYSGPLTLEGLADDIPESYLAGNGGLRDVREAMALDEDCMRALRNELELKLPLAQVASIEPAEESDMEGAAATAAETVVSYAGALSPIAEETRGQLSAYDNDVAWTSSLRSDSPSSEQASAGVAGGTYTLQGPSKEPTMSADSLNSSPAKQQRDSPSLDRTYNVNDKVQCEMISQVSPFLLSPSEGSVPENTGVSTLSKTDGKSTKPSETQCLSKATSIDSWCSNDTLFNVEDNFDDLAEVNLEFDKDDNTLHEDRDSHCSTYIVHDDQSENDSFTPDSITANHTYTKPRVEAVVCSDVSPANTQTKDLAYGTLVSGLTSCTTEVMSMNDEMWRLPQPELVRRSPVPEDTYVTPQRNGGNAKDQEPSPKLENEPKIKKMDSVEITCLKDDSGDVTAPVAEDSPGYHYRNMENTLHSTPLIEQPDENVEVAPMVLPETSNSPNLNVPNFQMFISSAELRPQDISPHTTSQDTGLLLEGESKVSHNSLSLDRTPNFNSFVDSAVLKPQEVDSRNELSAVSSEDFQHFENSVRGRPQDLSAIEATSFLLKSEVRSSELAMSSLDNSSYFNGNAESRNYLGLENEFDENEQPHSIIITENQSVNRTYDSHDNIKESTFDSHGHTRNESHNSGNDSEPHDSPKVNGSNLDQNDFSQSDNNDSHNERESPKNDTDEGNSKDQSTNGETSSPKDESSSPNDGSSPKSDVLGPKNEVMSPKNDVSSPKDEVSSPKDESSPKTVITNSKEVKNPINTKAEELKTLPNGNQPNGSYYATVNFLSENFEELIESNVDTSHIEEPVNPDLSTPVDQQNGHTEEGSVENGLETKSATESFLSNEKLFCQSEVFGIPLLNDIRFTGPASEIMSTSFSQPSPTDAAKEWDSDSDDSRDTNSSGEFIWKQRDAGAAPPPARNSGPGSHSGGVSGSNSGSGPASGSGSGSSGSEGDEVDFVPSSWDCRAAPAKSSLRSLEHAQPLSGPESKKRVVFKRQKYHSVYEYPREAPPEPAAPDYCTYAEWDAAAAAEAELGYSRLFAAPLHAYRAPLGLAAEYDDDFYITSSARPFESLGLVSSQFFPGLHALKAGVLDAEVAGELDAPPAPPPPLDLVTPDSGVEDITPLTEAKQDEGNFWRIDSSSSESASPSSPGNEALGGLRHTRDKLKLDLPPSPHVPSPRLGRVFSFTLEKPKPRHRDDEPTGTTPLVMTDETPLAAAPVPPPQDEIALPEPTFSTFGKAKTEHASELKAIILNEEAKPTETREATVLDSGDEDSGIESSAKASLDRKQPHVS